MELKLISCRGGNVDFNLGLNGIGVAVVGDLTKGDGDGVDDEIEGALTSFDGLSTL